MCTHRRWITNRYTHIQFLSNCGKCPSCLQEKAYKRSYRIKNEVSPDRIALFVTLTYDRASCPYVLESDVKSRVDSLPVYREYYTRRVPVKTRQGVKYLDKRYFELQLLNTIYFPDYESLDYRRRLPRSLSYRKGKIGVCYYPDVQLFKKRLNINLRRKYNYDEEIVCYSCSEYGETTARPHFHLLFFIRPHHEALFRAAISEAWPFASHHRTEKYIEVARDVANYIATYVNSGTDFHRFLSTNFKAKHSYSKDFGVRSKLFSLDSILSFIERRDMSFLRPVGRKGQEQYISVSVPKYVINRFFPLFKGYSRFTDSSVLDVLSSFIQSGKFGHFSLKTGFSEEFKLMDYSFSDLYKISVRLYNAYRKFCSLYSDIGIASYAMLYREAWKVYKATNWKLWYSDDSVPLMYRYDNSAYYLHDFTAFDFDDRPFWSSAPPIYDANQYPANIQRTLQYEQVYNFRIKEKKTNNFVASQSKYYV